jgi:hypothetical protein
VASLNFVEIGKYMRTAPLATISLALVILGACSDPDPEIISDAVPAGDAAKTLQTELRGYAAPVGVMMGLDEKPFWVQGAATGFRPLRITDVPAKITFMDPNPGCAFGAPRPDEILANVQVSSSPVVSTVYAATREAFSETTKLFMDTYQKHDAENLGDLVASDGAKMGLVDVFITEKSKPIYLVLSHNVATVFNIQLAEGAHISRIALIGNGAAGLANIDPATPAKALFGKVIEGCNLVPVRRPADHWTFVQNAKVTPSLGDELKKNFDMFGHFSAWYKTNFGVPSEPGAVGAESAAQVLVGPVPEKLEDRIKFKSLQGATVILSPSAYAYAGDTAAFKANFAEKVIEAATKLAGGDLTKLRAAQQ